MKRSHMQICLALVGLVALSVGLTTSTSCTEDQLRRADRVVADVNAAGTAIRNGTNTPGVPFPARAAGEVIGGLTALAVLVWREVRASKILERSDEKSVTLRSVADGIDQAPAKAAEEVKAKILELMKSRQVYDTANTVVDEHRSKLAS